MSAPPPPGDPGDRPYWDGLREHRLVVQRCARCGRVRHYPRPLCDACHAFDVAWVASSGLGTLHSWTVTWRPFVADFAGDLPYVLATVDMAEGFRLQAPLRGIDAGRLRPGVPLRVTFEERRGLVLPAFAPQAGPDAAPDGSPSG